MQDPETAHFAVHNRFRAEHSFVAPVLNSAKDDESLHPSRFVVTDKRTAEDLNDFTCKICSQIPLKPLQCPSTHIFCPRCIHRFVNENGYCPGDAEPISAASLSPSPIVSKSIQRLTVRCEYFHNVVVGAVRKRTRGAGGGCTWQGAVRDLRAHLEECVYRRISCEHCGQELAVWELEAHLRVCGQRETKCDWCERKMLRKDMEEHAAFCDGVSIHCPNRCGAGGRVIKRGMLQEHLKTCEEEAVECEFEDVGCEWKGKRKDKEKHEHMDIKVHLRLLKRVVLEGVRLMRDPS